MERKNNRKANELREIQITPHFIENALGSVEVRFGKTRVLCTSSVEERVPNHALERGMGWLTAEYNMLPASTGARTTRERNKISGRTQEIQRLIGRSLRSIIDLKSLNGYTLWIDCDVLQADGGTRTASITGAYVAMVLGLEKMKKKMGWSVLPILEKVAAVSVGIVGGEALLDLDYEEDVSAQVDMNLVMTDSGRFVEVQATAEGRAFTDEQLSDMKKLGRKGLDEIFTLQKRSLEK